MKHPIPSPDAVTAPYWDAARNGRLELQRCQDCRHFIHFPEPECVACGSNRLAFEVVSGRGRVETYTVVHRSFVPGFEERVPYAIGWVEMDEQPGLRAFGGLVGCDPQYLKIGMPVRAVFHDLAGFGTIPMFTVE